MAGTPSALVIHVTVKSHRCLLFALAAGAVLAVSASARAAEADGSAPATATLTREWVGLELTPVSFATSAPPNDGRPERSFTALQAGPGGNIRLFRFRGEHLYMIPILAGLYVSSGDKTIFAHVMAEGGLIVPGTDRRLELGAGLGLGILAMRYSVGCDGSCSIGGAGAMVSLAARFLFWNAPGLTTGINVRAIVPFTQPGGEGVWGTYTGHSSVVMGALEVGFGRP
jgi:hypothetical protein